jgi:hypothetical protein
VEAFQSVRQLRQLRQWNRSDRAETRQRETRGIRGTIDTVETVVYIGLYQLSQLSHIYRLSPEKRTGEVGTAHSCRRAGPQVPASVRFAAFPTLPADRSRPAGLFRRVFRGARWFPVRCETVCKYINRSCPPQSPRLYVWLPGYRFMAFSVCDACDGAQQNQRNGACGRLYIYIYVYIYIYSLPHCCVPGRPCRPAVLAGCRVANSRPCP